MRTSSFSELIRKTRTWPEGIIGIDGYHGVGKSTLACSLSTALAVPSVHLDKFLRPNEGTFVKSLQLHQLSAALQERPVIVEGVCLLDVMSQLGLKPNLLIYVEGTEPDPDSARGKGRLASEVRDYHRKWQPIDIADIFYAVGPVGRDASMSSTKSDVDVAFIQAKTKLALVLAIGGMLALGVGLVVLLHGASGQDQTIFKVAGVEISASGLGGVIMATSALWAFFSYKCRPIYSRIQQVSEKSTTKDGVNERVEYLSTTQITVSPKQSRADGASSVGLDPFEVHKS